MITQTTEIKELLTALSKAQAEFEVAKFDSKNPHFGNEFASLTSIKKATESALAKYGLSISQYPISDGTGHSLVTILGHNSGQVITSTFRLIVGKQDMQGLGMAITYARRYAKSAILGIVSDEDTDMESKVVHQDVQRLPSGTNGPKLISQPQQKRLFAIAQSAGWSEAALRHLIRSHTGQESTAAIPWTMYDTIWKHIEAHPLHSATPELEDIPFER